MDSIDGLKRWIQGNGFLYRRWTQAMNSRDGLKSRTLETDFRRKTPEMDSRDSLQEMDSRDGV